MDKKKKNAIIIIVCFVAFSIGMILLSYNYILSKRDLAFEKINLKISENKDIEVKNINNKKEKSKSNNQTSDNTVQKKKPKNINFDYIGTLEIPKINLTKGFVDMNSKHNTVDYNLQILIPSSYPDVDGGNFIIASHSGSSSISYFKNLYKLSVGDNVNIYYKNTKYIYKIENIYEEPKNGYVDIYRDPNITTLTLITCTKNNDNTQTIYICYLQKKESEEG